MARHKRTGLLHFGVICSFCRVSLHHAVRRVVDHEKDHHEDDDGDFDGPKEVV